MQDSVTVHIDAPPSEVWKLVSDVTQIGRFSPETFEGEWLDGAAGPELGVRFRGHVKRNGRGPTYWTTCRITTCEPERAFGFAVETRGKPVNNWRYDLEPRDGGTEVTESFRLEDKPMLRLYWKVFGGMRGRTNRNGMQTTLNRLKAAVEG